MASVFSSLLKDAKGWLEAPENTRLLALVEGAYAIEAHVPEARRADWKKLVLGFAREEALPRRRARVEGLVRACKLFAAEERAIARAQEPISARDPVDGLAGLGAKGRAALAEAGIATVLDLVWTLPIAWDDWRTPTSIADALAAMEADIARQIAAPRICVRGIVKSAGIVPMRGRRAVRVVLADERDPKKTLHAWWFFAAHGVLANARVGEACLLFGRIRRDEKKPARAIHPEIARDEDAARIVRPRYAKLGVAEANLRRAIGEALTRLQEPLDVVPDAVRAREGIAEARALLAKTHVRDRATYDGVGERDAYRALREQLAWVEAFARAWERIETDGRLGPSQTPPLPPDPAVYARLRAEFGFTLTKEQRSAIELVSKEIARSVPMRRLLLGDVGTGKTAVALAAAAQCVSARAQVAILAPTSVLAEQYMDAVAPLARATGVAIALVTGATPAAQRRRAEEQIASGKIAVTIGTHALLREGIAFENLGLVVVDEQHRLGVAQRLALVSKGKRPHLLTLSATPIPRTLALALRGELATSTLKERPKGRPPVATELRSHGEWETVVEMIRDTCARGERVFFIAPRIGGDDVEDVDEDEAPSVASREEELRSALPNLKIAIVHGALSPRAKSAAMRAFRSGEAELLVATTVVEVGVDVPEATLIVIDGAERFGLAQLHQMRGRVGRGDVPGRCVLLYGAPLDDLARRRLTAMTTLSRGDDIARADLELRGAGDLGGTRQSGAEEELLYLDPAAPPRGLDRIEDDARKLHTKDPKLVAPEHAALALALRRMRIAIAVREEAG